MSLKLRIVPFSDESLYSVLFRNAEDYRFTHLALLFDESEQISSIYAYSGNYGDTSDLHSALNRQAESIGIKVKSHTLNQFDRIFFRDPPKKNQRNRFYTQFSAKYCVDCLKEHYYHRLKWELNPITVCNRHGCYLIDECPGCGRRFSLSMLMQRNCGCGYNFLDALPVKPSNAIQSSQQIIQELIFGDRKQVRLADQSELSVQDYFYLFDQFGKLLENFPGTHELFKETGIHINCINYKNLGSRARKNDLSRNAVMFSALGYAVHNLIVNPEEYMAGFLKTLMEMEFGQDVSKRSTFRDILTFSKNSPYQESFRHAITSNGLKDLDHVRITAALKILQANEIELHRLMNIGLLEMTDLCDPNEEVKYFSKKSMHSLLTKRKDLITKTEVSKLLGIDSKLVVDMVKWGFFIPLRGPSVDGFGNWGFDREDIARFIDSFRDKAIIINHPEEDWISFRHYIRVLRHHGMTMCHGIQIMQDEKFTLAIESKSSTFSEMYISKKEFDSFKYKYFSKKLTVLQSKLGP